MGYLKFYTSILMIALFCLSLLMFTGKFAVDNNSQVVLNDTNIRTFNSSVYSNLTQITDDADNINNAFMNSTIKSGDEATVTGGQFKTGIGTNIGILKSSLTYTFRTLFGGDNMFGIIFTSIVGLIVIAIASYSYYAWKGGNPD